MTRGFITIATGHIHYYELAANLVKSYRYHTKDPYPFAIIVEEENEYTALFDDVIITKESTHSFMDKFLLLKLSPYDETIFFDADSLAYGDLNKWWFEFANATDFSSVGVNVGLHESGAWYNVEDIWKYGSLISYKTRIHLGVCFVRNSDRVSKLYDDCMDILHNYNKLHFLECENNYDESILGIAMPMNGMMAVPERTEMIAFFPFLTMFSSDLVLGRLSCVTRWGASTTNGILVHFGTRSTYNYLYKYEIERFDYFLRGRENPITKLDWWKYEVGIRKIQLSSVHFFDCVIHKIIRQIKKIARKVLPDKE